MLKRTVSNEYPQHNMFWMRIRNIQLHNLAGGLSKSLFLHNFANTLDYGSSPIEGQQRLRQACAFACLSRAFTAHIYIAIGSNGKRS